MAKAKQVRLHAGGGIPVETRVQDSMEDVQDEAKAAKIPLQFIRYRASWTVAMWKGLFGGKWSSRKGEGAPQNEYHSIGRQVDDCEEDGFVLVGESAIDRTTVNPGHLTASCYRDAPPSYESQVSRTSHYNPLSSYSPLFSSLNMGQKTSNLVTTEMSPEYVTVATSEVSDRSSPSNSPVQTPLGIPTESQRPIASSHLGTPRDLHRPVTAASSVISTLPGEVIGDDTFTEQLRSGHQDFSDCPLGGVPFKLATWLEYRDTDWSVYDCYSIPNIDISDFEYDFSTERNVIQARGHWLL